MKFLSSFNISASALTAQRMKMDIISQNIANSNTTRMDGIPQNPYRRKVAVFSQQKSFGEYLKGSMGGGVVVGRIVEDQTPFKVVYNPSHPDADEKGNVMMPNIDTMQEMVDMMSATRAYESNVTVLNSFKSMAQKALEIGR